MTKEEALFQYILRLGDSALILGHRMSEWCGHGPKLEQDIALINISLDLIGQARSYLTYAGEVEGKGRSEDDLAYFRTEREFRNALLTEQDNGDWGTTIVRSFYFDAFHYFFLQELTKSKDETLAAIATKSLKEVTYHHRHSSEWLIRLGDGTEESHNRVQEPIEDFWMYTGELFEMDEVDEILIKEGVAPDLNLIKEKFLKRIAEVAEEATLQLPGESYMQTGGKTKGIHTESLGFILCEMQYLPRTYPNATW